MSAIKTLKANVWFAGFGEDLMVVKDNDTRETFAMVDESQVDKIDLILEAFYINAQNDINPIPGVRSAMVGDLIEVADESGLGQYYVVCSNGFLYIGTYSRPSFDITN